MIMDKPIKAYTLNLARRGLFQEKSPCVIRCAARINTWSTLVPQICMMIFLTWHPQHLLLSLLTTQSATGQSKS